MTVVVATLNKSGLLLHV